MWLTPRFPRHLLAGLCFLGMVWAQNLRVEALAPTAEVKARQPFTLLVEVRNPTQQKQQAQTVLQLPEGWQVVLPAEDIDLAPGESTSLLWVIQPSPTALAGEYNLDFSLRNPQQPFALAEAKLRIRLAAIRQLALEVSDKPSVVTGGRYRVVFRLSNQGSVAESVRLDALATLSKELQIEPNQLSLGPNQSLDITLWASAPTGLERLATDSLRLAARSNDGAVQVRQVASVNLVPPPLTDQAKLHFLPVEVGASLGQDFRFSLSGRGQPFDGSRGRVAFKLDEKGLEASYSESGIEGGLSLSGGQFGLAASGQSGAWQWRTSWGGPRFRTQNQLAWRLGQGRVALGFAANPEQTLLELSGALEGQWLWQSACDLGSSNCNDFSLSPLRYSLSAKAGYDWVPNRPTLEASLGLSLQDHNLEVGYQQQERSLALARYSDRLGSLSFSLSAAFGLDEASQRLEARLGEPSGGFRWQLRYLQESGPKNSTLYEGQMSFALGNGQTSHKLSLAQEKEWQLGYQGSWSGKWENLELETNFNWQYPLGGQSQLGLGLASNVPLGTGTLRLEAGGTFSNQLGLSFRVGYKMPLQVPIGRKRGVGEVVGQVLDSSGAPVVGVVLTLGELAAITDAKGHYSFPAAPIGRYGLSFLNQDYLSEPALPLTLEVKEDQSQRVNITVAQGAFVRGSLRLSPPPNPEPGVLYGLPGVDERKLLSGVAVELVQGTRVLRRNTDGAGNFSFGPLPPGRWELRIYTDRFGGGYNVEPSQQIIELVGGKRSDIEIKVIPLPRKIEFEEEQSL